MTARNRAVVVATITVVTLASGCGGSGSGSDTKSGTVQHSDFDKAADGTTCVADAKSIAGDLPSGFPAAFPFPEGSVLYHVEDRGKDGVIVSAITTSSLKDALGDLNGPTQKAGFKVSNGETEKHDAEANWSGNGFRGRWAIKESTTCKGEVSIQVLAAKS